MTVPFSESGSYKNITATTTLMGAYRLLGIFVSSASSTPTLAVSDGSTTVVNTFTPAAATFYRIPAEVTTSLKVTVSGTVDCCLFYTAL